MKWEKLLSAEKLANDESEPRNFEDFPINDFEKDYYKIISSAAFRRLQDKTQVFPLDKSDFIRTRLTHSIEVSTIARQLGIMIAKNTTKYKPEDITDDVAEKIASVLQCAGLLHDLGNPPFGHSGEATIGGWFREHLDTIQYKDRSLRSWLSNDDGSKSQMIADLENFEGNAQALRIISKAKYGSEINVSYAVISTLIKYPTNSLTFNKTDSDIKKHKLGYFKSEETVFQALSTAVGTAGAQKISRHPLTYVLEAADDIAYATADLEDAFKKDLFTLDEFIGFFEKSYAHDKINAHNGTKGTYPPEYYSDLLIKDLKKRRKNKETNDSTAFREWIDFARRWLKYIAVYRFSRSYNDIMSGNYAADLFHDTNHSISIKILKNGMKRFVFNTPDILKLELAAQTILSFLLEKFVGAALYYDDSYTDENHAQTQAGKKYMEIFSENYKRDYEQAKTGNEREDLYLRLLMVTDYISGMTDSYARTLYRELSGIE